MPLRATAAASPGGLVRQLARLDAAPGLAVATFAKSLGARLAQIIRPGRLLPLGLQNVLALEEVDLHGVVVSMALGGAACLKAQFGAYS